MPAERQMGGIITRSTINGQPISFFVVTIHDVIQNYHLNGQFYEVEELEVITKHFKEGQTFLDIGTNVGNHAIYVDKFLKPKGVITIEPNPHAIGILEVNLALNRTATVDTRYLGIGLGDGEGRAAIRYPQNNLGGATTIDDPNGQIRIASGDSLLDGQEVNFIKLDVEGSELAVLRGLELTIAAHRPAMFVEVQNENVNAFAEWVAAHRYRAAERIRRYQSCENFMLLPA